MHITRFRHGWQLVKHVADIALNRILSDYIKSERENLVRGLTHVESTSNDSLTEVGTILLIVDHHDGRVFCDSHCLTLNITDLPAATFLQIVKQELILVENDYSFDHLFALFDLKAVVFFRGSRERCALTIHILLIVGFNGLSYGFGGCSSSTSSYRSRLGLGSRLGLCRNNFYTVFTFFSRHLSNYLHFYRYENIEFLFDESSTRGFGVLGFWGIWLYVGSGEHSV